LEEDGTIITL
nr:Chain A, THR-ILE-ILE-THR-LEU [Mus musculus]